MDDNLLISDNKLESYTLKYTLIFNNLTSKIKTYEQIIKNIETKLYYDYQLADKLLLKKVEIYVDLLRKDVTLINEKLKKITKISNLPKNQRFMSLLF